MDVVRRYCIQDEVINSSIQEPLYQDGIRNIIYNHIFGNIPVQEIICRIRDYRRIGKDSSCEIEKLFYLQSMVDYFLMIKEDIVCGSDQTFEELVEEYKLDCIRDTLTCNYGLGNLVDELIDMLGLKPPYNGIDYMTIDLDDCQPFIVY